MTQMMERIAVPTIDVGKAVLAMDALIGRLTYDEAFATVLSNNPRETLEQAGIVLEKESIEAYMKTKPELFDKACEALFGLVDSDFLHNLTAPSCA